MAVALYRKYRSRRLADIVGQEHITDILSRALAKGRIAHAYLFTGPKGVGKTSIARILAHEINNLPYTDESSHLDIIEIDAASNNGVEDIRDLREKVRLAPVSAAKKVYIIDEVHMLSKAAFNALLKTLEEPPEHVVFILATTDVDKLPETIVSRTQRHTFRRASVSNIAKNLAIIAKREHMNVSKAALELIAEHSDGSYRDSLSLLDQLAHVADEGEEITPEQIETSLGLAPDKSTKELLAAVLAHDFSSVITQLKDLDDRGIQAKVIALQLIRAAEKHAVETPSLLALIDNLLSVGQSSLPAVKLMAVLGKFAAKNPAKSASLAATPIPKLAEIATTKHPKESMLRHEKPVGTPTKKGISSSKSLINPDWPKLLADIKKLSVPLYSVLVKSDYAVEPGKLVIYSRNDFYKKKLESPKYLQLLYSTLGVGDDFVIETIPDIKPSKNSKVAVIAAIMGGGEEVSVESLN